jgi:ABC-type amino acid transport substrate-binding protein
MKRTILTLLAPALLLPAAAARAGEMPAEVPVLIAEAVDAHGHPQAIPPIITAVISLVAQESGLNLVIRPYPWRRAQMMAENGEGLLYGAAITPERQRVLDFSRPVYNANQWLVSAARAPVSFRQWDDLRGKVISIGSGSKYGPEFEQRRDRLFRVEQNAVSMESRLKMLEAHHVDAVLVDSFRNAEQLGISLNCRFPGTDKWVVAAKPVGFEPVLIAVPKGAPLHAVLPALNRAITRLNKAGSIQKAVDSRSLATPC